MSNPITKVELVGFRGATVAFDLDSDPQKGMTMLFTENSSGKLSILDMVDAVANGGIDALDCISIGRNSVQYLFMLGTATTTLKVTVHSGLESWAGTLQRHAVSVSGPERKPIVKILSRDNILTLVPARPQEWYDHSPVLEVAVPFIEISYEK